MTAPIYNDTNFRAQFPAFNDAALYPPASLLFAWNMGANWVNQNQACWGLSAVQLQQAADLMAAVVVRNLYGPTVNGTQTSIGTPKPIGVTSGPIVSGANGDTSATIKLPEFGSSALASFLLSSPPYGPMLLALLQVAASVGPYIPSGRFSWVPP